MEGAKKENLQDQQHSVLHAQTATYQQHIHTVFWHSRKIFVSKVYSESSLNRITAPL